MAKDFTYLFGANSTFIEQLYQKYLENPESVDPSWAEFFRNCGDNLEQASKVSNGPSWAKYKTKVILPPEKKPVDPKAAGPESSAALDTARACLLINAYREKGHFLADLDPLGLEVKKTIQDLNLDINNFGFTNEDLSKEIFLGGVFAGVESATLQDLLSMLHSAYSSTYGVELNHINCQKQRAWIQNEMEQLVFNKTLDANTKKKILQDLSEVEGFEQFLHIKFPGAKRFSVEGTASSINAVEAIIEESAKSGVKEVVVGMPHRGRLNMLTKVLGKPYVSMISEFQGNYAHPEDLHIAGDVKYHLGFSADKTYAGQQIHLSLTPNPSHLEAVNPVVSGRVRAKQDLRKDTNRETVMGVLLHGDAAFAGQGVVYESLTFTDLEAYKTGGVVHVVVNNQIGFTTNPGNARKSRYPTELAKSLNLPIFHVNAEDPEAVVLVSRLAAKYRKEFKRDVVLDVVGYRLYGHNEGDEPLFTQPVMYHAIAKRKTATELYAEKLMTSSVVTEAEVNDIKEKFKTFLNSEFDKTKDFKPKKADCCEGEWNGFTIMAQGNEAQPETGLDLATLKKLGEALNSYPKDFNINSKIARQLEAKKKMMETGEGLDWSMGEALAFASTLADGNNIRITGQDACRGTFSHRHSVLVDQQNENRYLPLNNLMPDQKAKYEVHDSNLSEYAVLGFEYGYSLVTPRNLVIWEAQFGDFANGAQIMIDQFIASAETKWLRMSGLVMLLPHGYEGQGPEHSSARPERFLQLCADNNMQVANCTTPASLFHILRRQLKRNFRKPLVIMSPKSLLRHKLAVSNLKEFGPGTKFKPVIEDTYVKDKSKVKKVLLCTGKVYYELFEEREKQKKTDIAIIRLEQLYPFPEAEFMEALKEYKNAQIVWCQEEHKNMGAWNFICHPIEETLQKMQISSKRPEYLGRPASSSPAAGYKKMHDKEQQQLITAALN